MTEATHQSTSRGALPGNRNALRHGLFTREAIAARQAAREAALGNKQPAQPHGAA